MAVVKPIRPIQDYPKELDGHLDENGRLPSNILTVMPGSSPTLTMCLTPMRSFKAMSAAAKKVGINLRVTSAPDSYRPYEVQYRIFHQRYSSTFIPGAPTRTCDGVIYWQKPETAVAACPGTSNHGLGLALDFVLDGADVIVNWLVRNALTYGFSAEVQSEDWHWRYYVGDNIPQATLDFEESDVSQEDVIVGTSVLWDKAANRIDATGRNFANDVYLVQRAADGFAADDSLRAHLDAIDADLAAIKANQLAQDAKLDQILALLEAGGGGDPALVPHTHDTGGTGPAIPE